MRTPLKLALALTGALALSACSTTPETDTAATGTGTTGTGTGTGSSTQGQIAEDSLQYFTVKVGDRVFFATDSVTLDSEAQETLRRQAAWLNKYQNVNVTVEGHADERGTREYNLALGARRASAVRDFLASQGVGVARMKPLTFGKERPVALCASSSCWSQNRRAVSVVAGAPTS